MIRILKFAFGGVTQELRAFWDKTGKREKNHQMGTVAMVITNQSSNSLLISEGIGCKNVETKKFLNLGIQNEARSRNVKVNSLSFR
jgi:hypothetical protein